MNEETEQLRTIDEALLADAVQLLKARGECVGKLGCMQLPAPVFGELCLLILSQPARGVRAAHEWLVTQVEDAPSERATYRFADYLRQAYREAKTIAIRSKAREYVTTLAADDPAAMTAMMNNRTVELITDELLDVDSLGELETKRLFALLAGVRATSQNVMDRQKTDARLKALETAIEKAERDIALKQQKLDLIPARVKAAEEKVRAIQDQAKRGEELRPAVLSAIFDELTKIREAAA